MCFTLNGMTDKDLKECFDVDFLTGLIYWKKRPVRHFLSQKACNISNGCNANKQAGNVSDGYLHLSVNFKGKRYRILAHRLVYSIYHNEDAPDVIDHFNQQTLDNRPSNLCPSNKSHNAKNMKLNATNKCGIMGVWFDKSRSNYQCYIDNKGERISLGRRSNFLDACCLRKSKENEYKYSEIHGTNSNKRTEVYSV